MPALIATSAASEGASNGAPVTLTRPTAEVGDLIVVVMFAGNNAMPTASGGTPAFTTAVSVYNPSSSIMAGFILYRWMTAAEPTSYAFAPVAGRAIGMVRVYRNVSTSTPFGAAGTLWSANVSGGTTTTAPGVTTAAANTLVLALQGVRSANTAPNYTNPTGTALGNVSTLLSASPATNTVTGRVGDIAAAAPGPTGDTTVTHSGAQYRIGVQVPILAATRGQVVTSWNTAGVPAWATGYELVRTNGGVTEATVTVAGSGTNEYTDTTVGNGTFTYSLQSAASTWRSTAVTVTLSRSC
ncbi:hypothetical protein Sya03_50380 [Spirilliplanes yamanashiensis]|uniref:Uncharacterized protein n=2 Tax=Spirilliplanes yamanashiensis TaxID=42233 RepID=A0A8J3YBJ2_9ACTN|nr:hypothetical protein Sya03_50380 [Spirilliplanes yamanashiensis]